MPLGPGRAGVGVIGAPVAKVAVVGAAAGPGPSPVAKAAVVGAAVEPGPVARRQGRRRGRRRHTGSTPHLSPTESTSLSIVAAAPWA